MKDLRLYTPARVGLGSAGDHLPTGPLLALRLAHARARDAVQVAFDTTTLQGQMEARGWPSLLLESAAKTREEYLRRPDLGRRVADQSARLLKASVDLLPVVFVISNGLSAPAAEHHSVALLDQIFAQLRYDPSVACPVVVVKHGRVAIGDQIGERLQAQVLVILIGERPGLSSPDSLGVYITGNPHVGCTDAERNCVSNIHAGGLSYAQAAHKVVFLLRAIHCGKLSGVSLKDISSLEAPTALQGEHDAK